MELGQPFLALIHQHQIIAEDAVTLPLQRPDGALEHVAPREKAAGIHADRAPLDGEVHGSRVVMEVGGADGGGLRGAAEDAHVWFGAEDGARVGGDGVEWGAFVGISNGEMAVG